MKPMTVPADCPEFDEVFVVSDLHLGGRKDLRLFVAGEKFAKWLKQTVMPALSGPARSSKTVVRKVAVIINGDFVDFLASPANLLPDAPHFNPGLALQTLSELAADKDTKPVFDGLRAFVQNLNATLIITLGNHDLELAAPTVQRHLLDLIVRQDHDARRRIRFELGEEGFVCRVGNEGVWCVHGNSDDSWNQVDRARLKEEVAAFEQGEQLSGWRPNPGTQMVMDLLNRVKEDYRFVEILKPEAQAVPPLLLMIAPEYQELVESALSAFAYRCRNWLRDWCRSLLGVEQFLESSGRPVADHARLQLLRALLVHPWDRISFDADNDVAELLYRAHLRVIAGGQWRGRDDHRVDQPPIASANSVCDLVPGRGSTSDDKLLGWWQAFVVYGRGGSRIEVIQAFLKELLRYRGFDETSTSDSLYRTFLNDYRDVSFRSANGVVPRIRFASIVITGHTHQARANLPLGRFGEGRYFNSGTWAQVMRIPPETISDQKQLEEMVKKLSKPGNRDLMSDRNLVWSPRTFVRVCRGAGGKAVAELVTYG